MAAWLGAASAGCCFGNRLPPPPPATGLATGAQTELTLAPGFAPDPTLVTGTAGGPIAATTIGPTCVGSIAGAPNIVLTTTAAFSTLRFVVSAGAQDTTLVVRLANGQVSCDDDSGGSLNPAVTTAVPPGRHEIYVGEYNRTSTGVPFQLAITTSPTVDSASLAAGAHSGVPTACGLREPTYGPLQRGTMVTLAVHSSYTGPDGQGHLIGPADEGALNWAPAMQSFVGQRTVITELAGLDTSGCPIARVAADGGQFTWRIRDMRL